MHALCCSWVGELTDSAPPFFVQKYERKILCVAGPINVFFCFAMNVCLSGYSRSYIFFNIHFVRRRTHQRRSSFYGLPFRERVDAPFLYGELATPVRNRTNAYFGNALTSDCRKLVTPALHYLRERVDARLSGTRDTRTKLYAFTIATNISFIGYSESFFTYILKGK